MNKYVSYSFFAGLISAIVGAIYFGLSLVYGINPIGGSKAFGYILMLLLFFPSLWYFRKFYLNGEMHFHQAFFLILLIDFVSCILYALFIWLYLELISPDLLTRHIGESKLFFKLIKDDYIKTMGKEAFNVSLKALEEVRAIDIAIDEFWKRFIVLLIFGFIISFIMRKSPAWAKSR